jgi:isoleucyl-tRNA synthetase
MFFVVSQTSFEKSEDEILSESEDENFLIKVLKPKQPECPRCWRHAEEIETEGKLCSRCEDAVL